MQHKELTTKLEAIKSPNQQNQEQAAGVLAAVEDTLREQTSDFSATAYFAALLSLLDSDHTATVIYLLDIVAPHVPRPILKANFSRIFQSLANSVQPSAEAQTLKPTIGCLVTLLIAQDGQGWALSQTQVGPRQGISALWGLVLDQRPKVRKRAQEGLHQVLSNPPISPATIHPAAELCSEWALTASIAQATQDSPRLIHSLQLINYISAAVRGWPFNSIDDLCKLLLSVASSNNSFLTKTALDVFDTVFKGVASSHNHEQLPQLLNITLELKPRMHDAILIPSWLAIVSRAYDVAFQVDQTIFERLPHVFRLVSGYVASDAYNVQVSACECLVSFLANCLPEVNEEHDPILVLLATNIVDLLGAKYQAAWNHVCNVLIIAFERFKTRAVLFLDVVAIVGDMRGLEQFAGKAQADHVLSAAISAMGPEEVLKVLPLSLGEGQGRAWLLPLMRKSVRHTRLAHFKLEMLPIADKLELHAHGPPTVERKIMETLVHQIWSTLPGYCSQPLDPHVFDQAFAEALCNKLYQTPDLRLIICRALQLLVHGNEAQLSGFAPNLLAVLFNIYGKVPPNQRGEVLKCIDTYFGVLPSAEMSATFERVTAMLMSNLTDPIADDLMDIIVTASAYLPRNALPGLFSIAARVINQKSALQRKAYKIIPRLALSETCRGALDERSIELEDMLLQSGDAVLPTARKDRLLTLGQVLQSSRLSFIASILPEVILATKEASEKVRNTAYDLLVLMASRMHAGGLLEAGNATIDEFLVMLSAGLAGTSPHMISATVTAISRVFFDFHGSMSERSVLDLLSTMDVLANSTSREVVRSVLGFIKVCVIVLSTEIMIPRLPSLLPLLMKYSHEQKAHTRVKVKSIVERMIRRYGADEVVKHCPPEDRKLIANVRKVRERRKRKRHDHGQINEDARHVEHADAFDEALYSSESENDDSPQRVAALQQMEVDEPLDLLDPRKSNHKKSAQRAARHVASTVDPDGKLVFGENDVEEKPEPHDDGVNAYIEAVSGRHAAVRKGQRGRLKFTNKRGSELEDDGSDLGESGEHEPRRQAPMRRDQRRQVQKRSKSGMVVKHSQPRLRF